MRPPVICLRHGALRATHGDAHTRSILGRENETNPIDRPRPLPTPVWAALAGIFGSGLAALLNLIALMLEASD